MSTQAQTGYQTLLKRGNGASPEVFTRIAEVRKIGEFGSERGLIDVSNMDSLNNFMEYLLGMKDGVELPVEVNFLPANATQGPETGLILDHNNGTRRNFEMEMPGDFGTFIFTGLVRAWKASFAPNEAVTATFTLKLTGEIEYEPAA